MPASESLKMQGTGHKCGGCWNCGRLLGNSENVFYMPEEHSTGKDFVVNAELSCSVTCLWRISRILFPLSFYVGVLPHAPSSFQFFSSQRFVIHYENSHIHFVIFLSSKTNEFYYVFKAELIVFAHVCLHQSLYFPVI